MSYFKKCMVLLFVILIAKNIVILNTNTELISLPSENCKTLRIWLHLEQ